MLFRDLLRHLCIILFVLLLLFLALVCNWPCLAVVKHMDKCIIVIIISPPLGLALVRIFMAKFAHVFPGSEHRRFQFWNNSPQSVHARSMNMLFVRCEVTFD
jgi:hypothetical protein